MDRALPVSIFEKDKELNKGITINISSVPNTSDPIVIDSAPTDKDSDGT